MSEFEELIRSSLKTTQSLYKHREILTLANLREFESKFQNSDSDLNKAVDIVDKWIVNNPRLDPKRIIELAFYYFISILNPVSTRTPNTGFIFKGEKSNKRRKQKLDKLVSDLTELESEISDFPEYYENSWDNESCSLQETVCELRDYLYAFSQRERSKESKTTDRDLVLLILCSELASDSQISFQKVLHSVSDFMACVNRDKSSDPITCEANLRSALNNAINILKLRK
jgi:hypothetical protein